jgi:uncharacterized membrane protein
MSADPDLLAAVSFLHTLDEAERAAVATLMQAVRFPAGATLFREGDPGGVFYVIRSGRVELWVQDDRRAKLVVDVLEAGEFFGELSLLDGAPRSTSAAALTDVELFSLAREPFMDLLRRRSEVALDVLVALSRRLRKTDELVRRQVRNANEVVEEQETWGDRLADGVARFGGSWRFIGAFGGFLGLWMLTNTALALWRAPAGTTWDPYPFILLNLILSMLAALQAPVIMMSQNRQDKKDRIRAELDYQVNVRSEAGIERLHEKLDLLEARLTRQAQNDSQAS